MSSEPSTTPDLQQLYVAEKSRATMFKNRATMFEKKCTTLRTENDTLGIDLEQATREKAEMDALIQQLQTSLDVADRPATQSGAEEIQSLKDTIEEMKQDKQEYIRGNHLRILPFIGRDVLRQRDAARARSRQLETELQEVRGLKDALLQEYQLLMANVDDHMEQKTLFDEQKTLLDERNTLFDSSFNKLKQRRSTITALIAQQQGIPTAEPAQDNATPPTRASSGPSSSSAITYRGKRAFEGEEESESREGPDGTKRRRQGE